MYQITCNDEILYDVRLKNRIVLSPVLNLEVGKNGTLSFILPPQNDLYDRIEQQKSIIKVFQVDKIGNRNVKTELFRGTAYSEKFDFWNRKQVECEGELSFFNDSIIRPYSYEGDVEPLFQKYVNEHSSVVDVSKQFIPRRCTVVDPNGYITRANTNYPSTKSEMNEKLLNILGGHFETGANEDGTRWIDYLAEYENISSQIIEFGKNELDLSQFISSEDVKTRIVPLGKKDEQTGEYLTIKSVNNGLDYVQDNSAISIFGVKEEQVVFNDVTLPENLLTKGNQELQNRINKTISINVSAADLHNLDVNIEAFHIGEYVRVLSKPHNLDRYFLLSKLSLALDKPSECKMTLGAVFKSFTQKQIEAEKKLNQTVENNVVNVTEIKQNVQTLNADMRDVKQVIQDVPGEYVKTTIFNNYKTQVNQKFNGVHTEKGTVSNVTDLVNIQNPTKGDIYKIIDSTTNEYTRYIYTGTAWEELIDLNNYVDKTTFEALEQRVQALEGGNN